MDDQKAGNRNRERLSVTIDPDLLASLDEIKRAMGWTMALAVEKCLLYGLPIMERQEPYLKERLNDFRKDASKRKKGALM